MNNYRIYSSAAYTVFRMGPGVEILQLGTNETEWLQGDEANQLEDLLEVNMANDDTLSEYFGADR